MEKYLTSIILFNQIQYQASPKSIIMVHKIFMIGLMAAIATIVLTESPLGNDIQTIALIGIADNKSYFAEHDQTMDWFTAKGYCETYGMRIAELTSAAQEDLFRVFNATPPETRNKRYWVDAREARLPREFTWDRLETEFKPEHLSWFDYFFDEYLVCVHLNLHGTADFGFAPCRDQQYVMCETFPDEVTHLGSSK